MAKLSERERIEILTMVGYGDRRRTHQEACDLFNNVYPNRLSINRSTVSRTVRRFQETGAVKDAARIGRGRTATSDDQSLDILLAVNENPNTSLTQIGVNYDISVRSAQRILKRNRYFSYNPHLVQELLAEDFDRRSEFCEIMMERCNNNFDFINQILFSDEATFCLNGTVNKHNCRFWSQENPHWMLEHHTQHHQKINVWAGIIGRNIIGPFFINESLNSERYLVLLQNEIIPALYNLFPNENHPERLADRVWFQQDGAPAHFGLVVRQYLNNIFPNRWIGRRGFIEWPPRSPDLTPLDFYLWGHLKTNVYRNRPNNLEDLQNRLRQEMAEIPPEALTNCLRSFSDRLAHCLAVNGAQFEHLL